MNVPGGRLDMENNVSGARGTNLAPGLSSIITATHTLYPNQKNPLQVISNNKSIVKTV